VIPLGVPREWVDGVGVDARDDPLRPVLDAGPRVVASSLYRIADEKQR